MSGMKTNSRQQKDAKCHGSLDSPFTINVGVVFALTSFNSPSTACRNRGLAELASDTLEKVNG